MTTSTTLPLNEVLDYLRRLGQDRARPATALARLRDLRERNPHTTLELLWEEEAFDASVHYDVLLQSEGGTAALSYCPDRVQPWPLRGVHRWSDQDLLRVNHTSLPVSQAVACLDFVWDQAPLVDRLVNVCLIQEELQREPIELSDTELQQAMDRFRRARRLHTAGETLRWMTRRGITHTELEALVGDEAIVARLRGRIADGRVEPYFVAHRADFDTVHVVSVAFEAEDEARIAAERLRSGASSVYDVAQSQVLATRGGHAAPAAFEVLQRGADSDPASAASRATEALLSAAPGDVVGPVWNDNAHVVALILAHTPARLDAPTSAAIERVLFKQWLDERRAQADIEWFWWNTARTNKAAG